VQRSLGGWRIPHAELRQMIQHGLLDRAEALIQELNQHNPALVIELYRYQIWVEHSRQNWQTLIDHYEQYANQLGTGLYLTLVADAYLGLEKPAQAGQVLLPLLSSDVPSADRAPAYALAAECHFTLGEVDEARTRLLQAWRGLGPEEQAKHQGLFEQVQTTPPPEPVERRRLSEEVLKELINRAQTEPVAAFYDLRAYLAEGDEPVPLAATLLLGRLAVRTGEIETARTAYETLWTRRQEVDGAVVDEVREHLIRDAANRGTWADVPQYVKGWLGLRLEPDLLLQIGRTFDQLSDASQAERFYKLTLERGADHPHALRFLATLEHRRLEDTGHDQNARHVHEYFTRLVALPEGGLRPDEAEQWLGAMRLLNMNQEAEVAIQNVLDGLTIYEYADWVNVFAALAEHVWSCRRPAETLVRAFAEHLLAAQQAGRSSKQLIQMFDLALQRLGPGHAQVYYLEEVEALQDAALSRVVRTTAENAALQEMSRGPSMDHDLLHSLLLLTLSAGGEAAYAELATLYNAQVDVARHAGAEVPNQDLQNLLSNKRIALVGGHEHWQRLAHEELTRFYGASTIRLVPASWEENQDEATLATRLRDCDLILVMWKCMKHSTSVIIRNLINRGVIASSTMQSVSGTGGKGFVREVIKTLRS